jgi:hypothetical protein
MTILHETPMAWLTLLEILAITLMIPHFLEHTMGQLCEL